MTKAQYALAYKNCTNNELRKFLADRGLDTTWRSRRRTIHALHRADHDATFRFFDLTAELRNEVYWELLTLQKPEKMQKKQRQQDEVGSADRQVAHPAILRASKQVHQEASGMLYAPPNEAVIAFKVEGGQSSLFNSYTGLRISVNHREVVTESFWTMHRLAAALPKYLVKFARIRVVIERHEDKLFYAPYDEAINQLGQTLYALASAIKGRGKLKHLSIHVNPEGIKKLTHNHALDPVIDCLKGNWVTETVFKLPTGQEEQQYPATALDSESAHAMGPHGEDRLRNCLYFEIKLSKIINSEPARMTQRWWATGDKLEQARDNVRAVLNLKVVDEPPRDTVVVEALRDAVQAVQEFESGSEERWEGD